MAFVVDIRHKENAFGSHFCHKTRPAETRRNPRFSFSVCISLCQICGENSPAKSRYCCPGNLGLNPPRAGLGHPQVYITRHTDIPQTTPDDFLDDHPRLNFLRSRVAQHKGPFSITRSPLRYQPFGTAEKSWHMTSVLAGSR